MDGLCHSVVEQRRNGLHVDSCEGRRARLDSEDENEAALHSLDYIFELAELEDVCCFAGPGRLGSWARRNKNNAVLRSRACWRLRLESLLNQGSRLRQSDVIAILQETCADGCLISVQRSDISRETNKMEVKGVEGNKLRKLALCESKQLSSF